MIIQKVWRKALNAGVQENSTPSARRSIRVMNTISLIVSPVAALLIILIFTTFHFQWPALAINIVVLVTLVSIPVLNSMSLDSLARLLWTSIICLGVLTDVWSFGQGNGFEAGFIFVQASVFVFCMDRNEINLHSAIVLVSFLTSLAIFFYDSDKRVNLLIYHIIMFTCISTIYFCFRVLFNENERYEETIKQQNTNLKYQAEIMELKNSEIQLQRAEIQSQADLLVSKNEALRERNAKLEELDLEKDGLMGIVAHDLRVPLNRTKGLAGLLNSYITAPDGRQIVDKITAVADDGLLLIKDILDVNAIKTGTVVPSQCLVNLSGFIKEEMLSQWRETASAKAIEVQLISDGEELYTDSHSLKRILDNVVGNAIKFSNPNSLVIVHSGHLEDITIITVQDFGPGFTDEDQRKMFRKFQRLSARPTAGESSTGLGLAIVKSLMDKLQGEIEVKSVVGVGTEFILKFKRTSSSNFFLRNGVSNRGGFV